jgi:UDP-3-O-acyl N-acetylglucosamine deacetylase
VAVVEGFGFWSGRDIRVEFHPAGVNTGLVFIRDDLSAPEKISATIEHRIETPRRTTLTHGSVRVEMVEHIMAALCGLGVTNCEIHANESEMPGCDGSSTAFVEALDAAGVITQDALQSRLVIRETIRVGDSDHWIEARPASDGKTSLRYRLDYTELAPAIGRQTAEFVITPEVFRAEIARCRTFMLEQEAKWLLSQGLGTRVRPTDVLIFDQEGPKENTLRFKDECVRHKILDMVGDFALAGCHLVGRIIAHRSGHRLNAELIKVLLKEGQVEHFHQKSA